MRGKIRLETLSLRKNLSKFQATLLLTMIRNKLISDIVPEANQDHQDNVKELPVQQTQQPQEEVLLRRSTRERRSVISDDYIVFL